MVVRKGGHYWQEPASRRTTYGIAVVVQVPDDQSRDRVDLWWLEDEIISALEPLFEDGARAAVSVVISGPDIGDAPEWLLERAAAESVSKFDRAERPTGQT